MDPITTAILAAVLAGATAGLTDTTKKVIAEGYEALKAKIKAKFGAESDLTEAVAKVEAKPDSEGRKTTLQEEVETAKADQDPDLLAAAQKLMETIQSQTGQAASAIVNGNGVIVQGNVGGDVVTGTKITQTAGDNAIQIGQAGDVTIDRK